MGFPFSGYSGRYVGCNPVEVGRAAEARIAELDAENAYVREKIKAYIASKFDPGMMGPTLDDIRHHLKIE